VSIQLKQEAMQMMISVNRLQCCKIGREAMSWRIVTWADGGFGRGFVREPEGQKSQ